VPAGDGYRRTAEGVARALAGIGVAAERRSQDFPAYIRRIYSDRDFAFAVSRMTEDDAERWRKLAADGRRATTHWAYVGDLRKAYPTIQWVPDRRYVVDNRISTSTSITASIPATVALVEAIAGRPKAEQLARELGVASWDARHRSSAFQLTWEHRKTFLRNWLSFWRHHTVGVPLSHGVDEIALGLTVDAYSRTAMSTVVTVGSRNDPVRSRHGLMLHPNTSAQPAAVDHMLPLPGSVTPALTIDRELAQIAARFGHPTAEIVALVVEYPWVADAGPAPR
jgi:hypothetical protein